MSSLFRKYGQSLLGDVGIENARVRQEKNAETQGTFQNDARYRRVARRGYRDAMRRGNFKGAMDSLDWLETKGQSLGSGIGLAGVQQNVAANPAGGPPQAPQDPNAFANKSPANQNLDLRLGLFSQMKESLVNGGNLKDYWQSAKGLGVSEAGFGNAMERAQKETFGSAVDPLTSRGFGQRAAPAPTSTTVAAVEPNPNSPDFNERSRAQGRALNMWDRNRLA